MKIKVMLLAVLMALPSLSHAAGAMAVAVKKQPEVISFTHQEVLDMQLASEFKMVVDNRLDNSTQVIMMRQMIFKYLRAKNLAHPDKGYVYDKPPTK